MIPSDYGKGALNDVPGMIRRARVAGIPVLVDPRPTSRSTAVPPLLTPTCPEFEAVVGKVKGEDLARQGDWIWSSASELDALLNDPVPRTV